MNGEEDILRKRILSTLENGAKNTKNFEWMKTHLLAELSLTPSDLRNILKIMWNDGTVGQTYGNYWLKKQPIVASTVSADSLWYRCIVAPSQKEYLEGLKRKYTVEQAKAMKIIAAIILDEPLPKVQPFPDDAWDETVKNEWDHIMSKFYYD